MTKKTEAIISPDFVRAAKAAVESGDFETYDLKHLLQFFCWMAKTDEGAWPDLQKLVAILLERALPDGTDPMEALRLRKIGRPRLGIERDAEICTYIAKKLAEGFKIKVAKEMAEEKFIKGNSSINGIWTNGKNMGIALFLIDRRDRGRPLTEDELRNLRKYAGKNIKHHLHPVEASQPNA